MYSVSTYRRIRIDYEHNGLSQRELSRNYGLHRDTIRKMLEFSISLGYQRKKPPSKPKLSPFKRGKNVSRSLKIVVSR
jgi:hypothetical protein